ncbi:hypothetical protein MIMGU_mgv1a0149612mg, partial [Erythranthe guttata]
MKPDCQAHVVSRLHHNRNT